MTLKLEIELADAQSGTRELSVLDAVIVALRAYNTGQDTQLCPTDLDQSGALTVVAERAGEVVWTGNGLSSQELMLGGRIDDVPQLAPLPAGASRSLRLNLVEMETLLPAGELSLYVELRLHGETRARSNTLALSVRQRSLRMVQVQRSNPVLDGLSVLLQAGSGPANQWYVRLYNTSRPLAAWYAQPLAIPESALPLLAAPTFFQTDSFEPFSRRWLVYQDAGDVVGQELCDGVATGSERRGSLAQVRDRAGGSAPVWRLLAAALDYQDELWVFFCQADQLMACVVSPVGLDLRFVIDNLPESDTPRVVCALGDRVVVVCAKHGIERIEVSYAGQVLLQQRCFNTDLRVTDVRYDPVADHIKAGFSDADHLQWVQIAPEGNRVFVQSWEELRQTPALQEVLELAWDVDGNATFVGLASTASGLFVWGSNRTPVCVKSGVPEAPMRPWVAAEDGPYLGFAEPTSGFNFYHFRHGRLDLRRP